MAWIEKPHIFKKERPPIFFGAKGESPRGWELQFRPFSPLPLQMSLLFFLWGLSVELWPRFNSMDHPQSAAGLLWGVILFEPRRPTARREGVVQGRRASVQKSTTHTYHETCTHTQPEIKQEKTLNRGSGYRTVPHTRFANRNAIRQQPIFFEACCTSFLMCTVCIFNQPIFQIIGLDSARTQQQVHTHTHHVTYNTQYNNTIHQRHTETFTSLFPSVVFMMTHDNLLIACGDGDFA